MNRMLKLSPIESVLKISNRPRRADNVGQIGLKGRRAMRHLVCIEATEVDGCLDL